MATDTAATTPLATYGNSWRGAVLDAGPAVVLCLGLAAAAAGTAAEFAFGIQGERARLAQRVGVVGAIGGGVLMYRHRRVRRVELFDDRFVWNDGTEHSVQWSGVRSVAYAPQRVVNQALREPSLTVECQGGVTLKLSPSIANLADLAVRLQAATLPNFLERAEADLDRGPVRFGPVTVDRRGLSFGHDIWDWDSIEYAIDSGGLVVVPASGNFRWDDRKSVSLAEVPNAAVLLAVMAYAGKPPVDAARTLPRGHGLF